MYPSDVEYTTPYPNLLGLTEPMKPVLPQIPNQPVLPDNPTKEQQKTYDDLVKARDKVIADRDRLQKDYNNKLDEFLRSNAASNLVTNYSDRPLSKQSIRCYWHIERHNQRLLQLPSYPVFDKDKLTISDSDGNLFSYTFSKPNALMLNAFATKGATLTLQYVGGYEKIPQEIKSAVKSIMQAMRETDYNVKPSGNLGGAFAVDTEMPIRVLPFAVKQLLAGYRLMRV